ncbi:MAG: hypothetical protein JXA74_14210 [Anaerolineae bacterium]|nr:hypothetical protein [Anaerolineae bacterium]
MQENRTMWKRGLIALLAAALFTAGLGILIYVLIARNRITPTPTPRPMARASSTLIPSATLQPSSTPPATSPTPEPRDRVVGVVQDYSPGALIIIVQPTEGSAEQIIVPENLEVTWADGRRASPREIAPGQTLLAEGELDSLGRLVAQRIVITQNTAATSTPLASPTPLPAPTSTPFEGWMGEYYGNKGLNGSAVLVRRDPAIDFQWAENAPAPGMPSDNFSVRWRGRWRFDQGGYRFYAFTDDGVRLWIDGTLIIDQWRDQSPTLAHGDHYVRAGEHDLQIEYYDATHNAEIRVWWDFQGSYPDWEGDYFDNPQLQGDPVVTRNDADVAFDWGYDAPAPGVPADDFSVRWSRQVSFEEGPYRFFAKADDAVRLWLDDVLLIDEWHENDNLVHERYLWIDSGSHDLRVEYAEHKGTASVRVWWRQIEEFEHWRGAYYANPDLQGRPLFVLDDEKIDFNWAEGSRGYGLPNDNYSVRWTRRLELAAGTYLFWAEADDGVRIYVDGQRVIDEWHDSSAQHYEGETTLTAGMHEIRVDYYERGDKAVIRVGWGSAPTRTPTATWTATTPASATPTLASATPTSTYTGVPPTGTPTSTQTTAPATATATVPTATVPTATLTPVPPTATETPAPPTATPTTTEAPTETTEPTATEPPPTETATPEPGSPTPTGTPVTPGVA